MPPKAKFSRNEIVEAALDIVRTDGFSMLTARALGAKLGSSARPIFTIFQNMEEVQQAVLSSAKELYTEYVKQGLSEKLSFRGVGIQYILFAINEPKLFQLLFMWEQNKIPPLSEVLPLIDYNYENILLSIEKDYKISGDSAKRLYHHLWIYTHGIATLSATKMCSFMAEEIEDLIKEICISLLKNMKEEHRND